MDILEQYIFDNKRDFDTAEPSINLWSNIEQRLDAANDNYDAEADLEAFIEKNRMAFDSAEPSKKVWASIDTYLAGENIEKYVRENKFDFNQESPNLKIWANIEKSLDAPKQTVSVKKTAQFRWLLRSAAAIALLFIGAAAGIYMTQKESHEQVVVEIAPDFNEAEQFYNERMRSQMNKLVGYNPDPSVLNDLSQIDKVQEELKAELLRAPNESRADIVKRMIENYQIKLGILERVLNYIEKHQIEKQNSHSHNDKKTEHI